MLKACVPEAEEAVLESVHDRWAGLHSCVAHSACSRMEPQQPLLGLAYWQLLGQVWFQIQLGSTPQP